MRLFLRPELWDLCFRWCVRQHLCCWASALCDFINAHLWISTWWRRPLFQSFDSTYTIFLFTTQISTRILTLDYLFLLILVHQLATIRYCHRIPHLLSCGLYEAFLSEFVSFRGVLIQDFLYWWLCQINVLKCWGILFGWWFRWWNIELSLHLVGWKFVWLCGDLWYRFLLLTTWRFQKIHGALATVRKLLTVLAFSALDFNRWVHILLFFTFSKGCTKALE